MSGLAERLEAAAPALAEAAARATYSDPFWMDRFGQRGLEFSRSDGALHVGYLARAIAAGGPETLETYARWLQTVLTTRGMTTRHLEQHFAVLAQAIAAHGLDEGGEPTRYLAAARKALRRDGIALALQEAVQELGEAAARGQPPERVEEALVVASFLADAAALGSTARLLAHLDWLRGYHARAGAPAELVPGMLAQLQATVQAQGSLPEEARRFAQGALAEALTRAQTHSP